MHYRPCSDDPDLWFSYADDDASDGAAKARAYRTLRDPGTSDLPTPVPLISAAGLCPQGG